MMWLRYRPLAHLEIRMSSALYVSIPIIIWLFMKVKELSLSEISLMHCSHKALKRLYIPTWDRAGTFVSIE